MALRAPLSRLPSFALPDGAIARDLRRRIDLAREPSDADAELGKPSPLRLLAELDILAEPARRVVRRLEIIPSANPQTVLILPGFATQSTRFRYLARQLERAGHTAKRWV